MEEAEDTEGGEKKQEEAEIRDPRESQQYYPRESPK